MSKSFVTEVRGLLRHETVTFLETDATLSWLDAPARVPVVIAGTGPRMIRTAGRIADGVILHHGVSPALIARALGWLDGATVEVSCWTPYSLGSGATEARDRIRGRVAGALMNAKPAVNFGAPSVWLWSSCRRVMTSATMPRRRLATPRSCPIVWWIVTRSPARRRRRGTSCAGCWIRRAWTGSF